MGSSSSDASQQTTNADNRIVADGGSVGVASSSNNTVTINTLDGGLIEKGFNYLSGADSANTDRLEMMLAAGAALIGSNQQLTSQVLEAKKAADTTDSSKATLYLALLGAGIIIMGRIK